MKSNLKSEENKILSKNIVNLKKYFKIKSDYTKKNKEGI